MERDTLVILTSFNSTSFFIYRGARLGFEYELLKYFAEDNGIELKHKVVKDRAKIFDMLNLGKGDIAGARLIPAAYDTPYVSFTNSLYTTRPVVVQKELDDNDDFLPESVDTILEIEGYEESPDAFSVDAKLVEKPEDLIGEVVHIPKSSPYENELVEISNESTGEIEIIKVGGKTSYESLIREVSRGDIELTVSHENIARLKQEYFQNIVIKPVIGPVHKVAWAVRKNSPQLLAELNKWIENNQKLINSLYNKYFIDRKGYKERMKSEYLTSETGRLSEYDNLFRKYSTDAGLDWRLVASQAYQESRFNPRAKSWAGATGLMQLMYRTARSVGVKNRFDPEQNVRGAMQYMEWLFSYWDGKNIEPKDEIKFVLASYNAGIGHVGDARRLADKFGDNPAKWSDVSFWLLQKSKKKYYSDKVVKYGYCRGIEPVTYVSRILDRYDHYVEFVDVDLLENEDKTS